MTKDTILVVFGAGSDNQPHAARAKGSDARLVAKAAEAMGYVVGIAKTTRAKALAKQLPEMKLYVSGRALLPRVKRDLYNELVTTVTVAGQKSNGRANSGQAGSPEPAELVDGPIENPWGAIDRGALVLVEDPNWYGWYEAHVIGFANDGKMLLLRWRDWPKQKPFTVLRIAVAIHPSARPKSLPNEATPAADQENRPLPSEAASHG